MVHCEKLALAFALIGSQSVPKSEYPFPDTMVCTEESADAHSLDGSENYEYEAKCGEQFSSTETEIVFGVADKPYESPKRTVLCDMY
ncbi:hypothetical protein ACLB2K_047543 [Fragaria x ananassa]